jgi:alanyl-tRNA synthetase
LIDGDGESGVADFEVVDVQVFNGYVLHIGYMKEGTLMVDDEVISQYDEVGSFNTLITIKLTFI